MGSHQRKASFSKVRYWDWACFGCLAGYFPRQNSRSNDRNDAGAHRTILRYTHVFGGENDAPGPDDDAPLRKRTEKSRLARSGPDAAWPTTPNFAYKLLLALLAVAL